MLRLVAESTKATFPQTPATFAGLWAAMMPLVLAEVSEARCPGVETGQGSWNSCGAVPGASDPRAIVVAAPGEAVGKIAMAVAH